MPSVKKYCVVGRARIKISCEKLRELVPGITLKTDKATVFEFAVEYLAFLKRLVGPQYDKVTIFVQ